MLQNILRDEILSREPLSPDTLIGHATANPGAGDEMHVKYVDATDRDGWAHYYLDHNSIRQTVSEGWVAPAQGKTMNRRALSFEMCEPDQTLPWDEQLRRFTETWKRGVWLASDILTRWNWSLSALWNHQMVSQKYPADTDHQDPIAFFERYGKTWQDFVLDVSTEMRSTVELPAPLPYQQEFMDQLLAQGIIHQRRHPSAPVVWWELAAVALRVKGG